MMAMIAQDLGSTFEGWTSVSGGPLYRRLAVRRSASVARFGEERRGFLGRSSTSFRALIEGPGDGIELTVAALPAGDLFAELEPGEVLEDLDRVGRSGYGYEVAGHPPLREALAGHLTERWRLPTVGEQIIVTTGAQQAIGLAAELYTRSGDAAVIEDPTYLTAIDVFTAGGLRLASVSTGVQGVRPERLREAIVQTSARFSYLMPTFHNPVGSVMPERERREVAYLADELQVPVIEDLTTADLALAEEPPPPIGAFQGQVPVLTIGSLSKVLWGGLRIGWIRAPEPVVQRLARIKLVTDHGSSTVSQVVAVRLMRRFEELRERRRALIRGRKEVLESLLRERLPGWTWDPPSGGLCLWVRLPEGDATAFAAVAVRHGVTLVPGPMSSVVGGFADRIRLPYVLDPGQLRDGVERLARAWAEYEPRAETAGRSVRVVV
jgi:DNA-binding transcriptional MocR family regulator